MKIKTSIFLGVVFLSHISFAEFQFPKNPFDLFLKTPKRNKFTKIKSGGFSTCGLTNDWAICWGKINPGQSTVPPLKNPREIEVGFDSACALDDEGIKCWGEKSELINKLAKNFINPVINISLDSVSHSQSLCGIDQEGLKCFDSLGKQLKTPEFKNPIKIKRQQGSSCVLDDEGISCFGNNDYGQLNISTYVNPTDFGIGFTSTCVLAN